MSYRYTGSTAPVGLSFFTPSRTGTASGGVVNPSILSGRTPTTKRRSTVSSTSLSNSKKNMMIANLMQQMFGGQQETKKEFDIPWDKYNEILAGKSPGINTAMTDAERAAITGRDVDAINAWAESEKDRISRLPSGLGATSEAERELSDEMMAKKLQSTRDTGIEQAQSQREYRASEQMRQDEALNAIAMLAQQRQQSDILGMGGMGDLIAALISGDIDPSLMSTILMGMQGSGGGYGGYGGLTQNPKLGRSGNPNLGGGSGRNIIQPYLF